MVRFLNSAALTLMAAIVAGYEAGLLTASNAFFGAVALGTIVLGVQFLRHEGQTVGYAAKQILAGPSGHVSTGSYLSFLGVMVLSTALALQVVIGL